MFLSHQAIEHYIGEEKIVVMPECDYKNIRPVGLRVHLGKYILVPEPNQTVSLTEQIDLRYKKIDLSTEEFYLEPDQFILGSTYEAIKTPRNILALLDGRSTVARLGLTTHITASVIDGTFEVPHSATLEIKNVGNFRVRLKEKDPIALMLFVELKDPITQKLQSQYQETAHTVAPPNLRFKTGTDK